MSVREYIPPTLPEPVSRPVAYQSAAPAWWLRTPVVLRRLIVWTAVCSVSAAPSFAMGLSFGSAAGMICGVALFVAIYTAATCTESFERFYRRPFVRTTMYIGYGLRLLLSASTLLWALRIVQYTAFPDIVCGMVSGLAASKMGFEIDPDFRLQRHTASDPSPFVAVFVTTCIQGALLNVVVFVVMSIAYTAQKLFRKPPPDQSPRGFEVVQVPVD